MSMPPWTRVYEPATSQRLIVVDAAPALSGVVIDRVRSIDASRRMRVVGWTWPAARSEPTGVDEYAATVAGPGEKLRPVTPKPSSAARWSESGDSAEVEIDAGASGSTSAPAVAAIISSTLTPPSGEASAVSTAAASCVVDARGADGVGSISISAVANGSAIAPFFAGFAGFLSAFATFATFAAGAGIAATTGCARSFCFDSAGTRLATSSRMLSWRTESSSFVSVRPAIEISL